MLGWCFKSKNSEKAINLSEEKIAPGSKGDFEIEIDATGSDVNVWYKLEVVEEKNIPRNIKFIAEIYDEKGGVIKKTKEYKSFKELASQELEECILVEKQNQKRKIKIYWEWPFEEDDNIDTEDANLKIDEFGNSSLDCGFKIEIIGKQSI